MEKFITKFDKELLEIGYVTINDDLIELCRDYDDKVILTNEDDVTRTFKINKEEKYIEGIGIKGFFKKYKSPFLSVEHIVKNHFKLYNIEVSKKPDYENNRTNQILTDMTNFQSIDDKWFKLYEYVKLFINTTDDNTLQCLQQLTEIDKYEYQIKTVQKIFSQFRGRVLLCDEVGLGKTIEACMAMTEYIMRGLVKKVLILTPASLVDQWYNETKTLFNLDFIRADDPEFKKNKEGFSKYNKVIASISSAKRKVYSDVILKQQYDLVIVDEAHHLKNTKSVAWQFVNSLNKKYIFLLTATPVQNTLEELYNLITLLKPGQLRTYNFFKSNFVGDKSGLVVRNSKRLKSLLSNVMVRNKRSEVDVKFPKRFAYTYKVDLSDEEKSLYDDISDFIRERYLNEKTIFTKFVLKNLQERMGSSFHALLSSLESLLENESLSSDDKKSIEDFVARAEDVVDSSDDNKKLRRVLKIIKDFDGKMIIFTKYKKSQEVIFEYLKDKGVKTAEFHGSMRKKDKESQIQYFKQEAKVLVSTEAGGEGRNLQFCNGMINFDLPWNPMAIEQRIGRIHRIGQERDVYIYNLSASDTIEYYILELLDKKINMFELAIGEVDMILGDMDEKEDFGDIVMNAWVNSDDKDTLEVEIDKIADKLIDNKKRFEKIKTIDAKIFSDLDDESKVGS